MSGRFSGWYPPRYADGNRLLPMLMQTAWMDSKSFCVCSFVRSFEELRSRRRFVSR